MDAIPPVLTPDQAANYLQVNRGTVYRYIHEGKLLASRVGRGYRIPRSNVEHLLWASRARDDFELREYSDAQLEEFLAEDALSPEAEAVLEILEAPATDADAHR